MVYNDGSGLYEFRDSAFSEEDVLNYARGGEYCHDNSALFAYLFVGSALRAVSYELGQRHRVEVRNQYVKACFYEMFCHRAAHKTKPYKSDFHNICSFRSTELYEKLN